MVLWGLYFLLAACAVAAYRQGMVEDLIYDVGMYDGIDTAYYLAAGFRVIAIEANPHYTADAEKRFAAELKAGRLKVLNVGITDKTSMSEFWINDAHPDWSSFDRARTARQGDPHHAISIQCRRLDEIFAEFGIPFFLKIDIEGYDIVCCDQIPVRDKPRFISAELSESDLIGKLSSLGYNRFKMIRQFDFYPMVMSDAEPPKPGVRMMRTLYRLAKSRMEDRSLPSRLSRFAAARAFEAGRSLGFSHELWKENMNLKSRFAPDWKFITGSSGPFGEDTPGEWLTAEQVREIWQAQYSSLTQAQFELWCDLHATTV